MSKTHITVPMLPIQPYIPKIFPIGVDRLDSPKHILGGYLYNALNGPVPQWVLINRSKQI